MDLFGVGSLPVHTERCDVFRLVHYCRCEPENAAILCSSARTASFADSGKSPKLEHEVSRFVPDGAGQVAEPRLSVTIQTGQR